MKVLYLSCHAILEYDELKLFEEMGIEYFSLGSYIVPRQPVDPIRPALTSIPDEWCLAHAPLQDSLTQEFVDRFDVVIVMHVKEWIIKNWNVLRGKKVIWRTIGQSTPAYERELFPYRQDGLKVIRYSRMEADIQDNIGCDKLVYFYKDPDEFGNWNGLNKEAITFSQNMKERAEYCSFDIFKQIVEGIPAHVYGPKNENTGELNGGFMSYDAMRQKMRDSRVYVYTGTQPASYTLNLIEALMTGIPVVAVGPRFGNSLKIAGDAYEIPQIIQNTVNGFWSDDIATLQQYVRYLMDNHDVAKRIGAMGRQTAIDLFGKEKIKEDWRKAFSIVEGK